MLDATQIFEEPGRGFEVTGSTPGTKLMGGPHGFAPDFRNQLLFSKYVKRPIISLCLKSPGFFNLFEDSAILHGSLKDFVEQTAHRITGFKGTLNVEYVESEVTQGGEKWADFAKTTREQSTPTYIAYERIGKPITKFFDFWIRYGIGDADTNIPLVSTLLEQGESYNLTSDNTSMTTLNIVPSEDGRRVVHAYLCFNQMPKQGAPVEDEKELFSAASLLEVSIETTCTQLQNAAVNKLAQRMLDNLNYLNANVGNRALFVDDVSADLKAISDDGYQEALNAISQEQVD